MSVKIDLGDHWDRRHRNKSNHRKEWGFIRHVRDNVIFEAIPMVHIIMSGFSISVN